jgi:hypothetical protein
MIDFLIAVWSVVLSLLDANLQPYPQVTGCLNPSLFPFAAHDDGGQFDVRFPDGAQCTFGGYGASFIEQ